MKLFRERFKELRKEKNLSAVQLGKILNVSDSTIIRWENGLLMPRIDHLLEIVKFFNVSAGYLIGTEE